jgi:hypothetical protein
MVYLDTSVLIALLLPESDSLVVRSWLAKNQGLELGHQRLGRSGIRQRHGHQGPSEGPEAP